jgi:hypothetical protein
MVRGLLGRAPMNARRESIPGSGLPAAGILGLLTVSVGLFLVYNGLLWNAPREASHVTRFAVSYLAVLPLATGLLLALHRLTWSHLITTTGVVWAAKMVITAVLFQAFGRGTATRLQAVAPPATAITSSGRLRPSEYRAATSFASGVLRGHVRQGGGPVAGAVVFLEAPLAGRPAPASARVDLTIRGARYAEPLYLAHVDDELRVSNRDGVLHTFHVSGPGRLPPNRAMPPDAESPALSIPEPGVYHVHCDTHPGEGTWITVVDHPYAVRTGADGAFSLDSVPAGEARVVAVAATSTGARRASARATVRGTGATDLDIDLDGAREITP